jgi:hypothetical protein
VTTIAVLASAGVASAAPGQVTRTIRMHGPFATALWISNPSATSSVSSGVVVEDSELFVDQFTFNSDASGNVVGGTETIADVTNGFSFAIDQSQLTTASVSASSIPATTCVIEANFQQGPCSPTTLSVTVDWTGQGLITRQAGSLHIKVAGFSETQHINGTDRLATATGTFSGITVNPSDFQGGSLGFTNEGITTVCIGNTCG